MDVPSGIQCDKKVCFMTSYTTEAVNMWHEDGFVDPDYLDDEWH